MNPVDDVFEGKGKKPDPSERGREVLLREGAVSGDSHVRGYAVFMLGGLKDPGLVDYYISRLRDPDKKVRGQAAAALAAIGDQAIPALVPLLRDDDWVVRYRAVEAIGLMKDDRRAGLLIEALSDAKDHVRYMAAKGLSRLHTGAALEPLAGTLSDSNEYVRKMAARAVAGIGGSEARDRLEKAFSKETDPGVKSAIMDLIAGIKEE
ncbi:MAG: HEAT repeat domain-containing protein [Methanoregulaceae archaeon]|jgi:HEAT repeat protein|nr:HEAT repeat domain-containing protein [Methanoregulaceae archaeon]HRX34476.1 HEAT repeat domain-containing protein [Methanoregulaceae archaeon]